MKEGIIHHHPPAKPESVVVSEQLTVNTSKDKYDHGQQETARF